MQTITVDMTPGFRQPTIHYSQNDVGTTFAIDLRSRFGDTLPASPTVKIQATKPSGFGFSIEADSVVGSVATFTTVDTMTDEAGRFLAELQIIKDAVVIYTANFYMEGEANPHPIGTTDGSQETIIPTLTLLVERVEAAAASVLDMTVNATTLAAGSQATYSYDEDTNTATFGIPQGEAGAGAAGVTASAYSSSSTYAVGEYVIHNSNLYRCTTAITTAEAFTAAHWTQVVLADDVTDLKSDINNLIGGNYAIKRVPNEAYKSYGNGGIKPADNPIGGTITFTTDNWIKHAYIEVADDEIYLVSLRKGPNSWYYGVFTDEDGDIISYDLVGTGSSTYMTDYLMFVPKGAKRLYTASQTSGYPNDGGSWYIKKFIQNTDQIKADVISVENLDDVYVANIEDGITWTNSKWLITSTGEVINNSTTKITNYIDIHDYSAIQYRAIIGNNQTNFGLIVYDSSKNIVGRVYSTSSTANGTEDKVVDLTQYAGAYYVRLNYWYSSDLTYPSFYMKAYKRYALLNTINVHSEMIDSLGRNNLPITEDTQVEDYSLGRITNTGIAPHKNASDQNDRICTARYYRVYKGDVIVCNAMGMTIALYDIYKTYQTTTQWIYAKYTTDDGSALWGEYVCQSDGYVRFTFGNNGAELTEADFGKNATINHTSNREKIRDAINHGLEAPLSDRKPKKIAGVTVWQDGTFVNGNLWLFADGQSDVGNIVILDIDTGEIVSTKTHNLGHANGVDYNANNNCLITYYTENHNPYALVYFDPVGSDSLLKTDENCTIIPLFNDDEHLSPTSSLCWGENDNIIYVIDGVYSSYSGDDGVVADHISIHKVLLGMGDNDLSDSGYGTFISGKEETEYNGTAKVLKTYTGRIRDGIDTKMFGHTLQTAQGMEYDGFIYVGWGTYGHNFLAIQLDDDTNTYWVHHTYMYHAWDYSHTSEIKYEPELVALNNGRIYCGSTSVNDGSLLLSFER